MSLNLQSSTVKMDDGSSDALMKPEKKSKTSKKDPPEVMFYDGQAALGTKKTTSPNYKKQVSLQDPRHDLWKEEGQNALTVGLSALYGKLLVVIGIAFPMAEVLSHHIPSTFYEGYYLYLYFGSMLFMIYVFISQLRYRAMRAKVVKRFRKVSGNTPEHIKENDNVSMMSIDSNHSDNSWASRMKRHHTTFGSMYLRIGALAFGIGSMIYSGLEFGQFFELNPNTDCHHYLLALTPTTRMVFTFTQMYFIFLNSKIHVHRIKTFSLFGLMHMIGTNICVWFLVLVEETKHEITDFFYHGKHVANMSYHGDAGNMTELNHAGGHLTTYEPHHTTTSMHHHLLKRSLGHDQVFVDQCRRAYIMGTLVQNASPFLFPCTIEYSLICAAVCYMMWKSIAKVDKPADGIRKGTNSHVYEKNSPHHYSVDCARANKGLFLGLFIFVLTIISLIIFFVMNRNEEYRSLALMTGHIAELVLYSTAILAVITAGLQMRNMHYDSSRNLELDSILLIIAQAGVFIYCMFSIIGGHFTMDKNTILVLMTALANLLETTVQTMFILDASRRSAYCYDQVRKKPGREMITFLLVCNLAMWTICILEKSRADSSPIQLQFYGVWAWTIISHVSMPLAIFYRFHSTVCLCEIWNRSYKLKPDQTDHLSASACRVLAGTLNMVVNGK